MNFCAAILILKTEEDTQHFWHIMLCYFKKGKNTTEMQKKICAVYGEGAMIGQPCQKWFSKFHAVRISHWTILHDGVEQLRLVVIKLRH